MPGGEYLPPVVSEFKADIADFIAKLDEASLKLDEFKRKAGTETVMRISTRGDARQMQQDLRPMENTLRSEMQRIGQTSAQDFSRSYSGEFQKAMAREVSRQQWTNDLRKEMDRAGGDSGRGFSSEFRKAMDSEWVRAQRDAELAGLSAGERFRKGFMAPLSGSGSGSNNGGTSVFHGILPGGARATNPAMAGALLAPALVPAAAGLAYPFVAGGLAAAPGIVGTASMLPSLRSNFQDVTKAEQALQTQTDKYNAAASQTVTYLQSNSQAMSGFHALLGAVNPLQAQGLQLINQQNIAWQNLTPTQQASVIALRQDNSVYKDLTQSQKDSINALLAQRNALNALSPAQQQAVTQYAALKGQLDNLKQAAAPGEFQMIASAERVVTDAMRPLLPLINATSQAWKNEFDALDKAINSPGYKGFIADMTGAVPGSIHAFAYSIGQVALAFYHMMDALSPMAGNFEQQMMKLAHGMNMWSQSSTGQAELQHFMSDLQSNGPAVWSTIGNIARAFSTFISVFASNPIPFTILRDVSGWLNDIIKVPFLGPIVAWATWLGILGSKLGVFERLVAGLKAVRDASLAAAAAERIDAGAEAAQGDAAMTDAGKQSGLLGKLASFGKGALGIGGAAAGDAAAGGAGLGGLGGMSALAGPVAAVAVPAVVIAALQSWSDHIQAAQDRAAGVIRGSDGVLSAATQKEGFTVDKSFRDMANNITTGGDKVTTSTMWSAQFAVKAEQDNIKLKDVMGLLSHSVDQGQADFAQHAGEFAAKFGVNVGKMGQVISSGTQSMQQHFQADLQKAIGSVTQTGDQQFNQFGQNNTASQRAAFAKIQQNSQQDYQNLQQDYTKYEADLKAGRTQAANQDFQKLTQDLDKFQHDSTTGQIANGQQNIAALGRDLAKYYSDMSKGNDTAAQGDLKQFFTDLKSSYQQQTLDAQGYVVQQINGLSAAAQAAVDAAVAQAQQFLSQGVTPPATQGNPVAHAGGYAGGGLISVGTHGTADDVLMRASKGEFVVNAEATKKHLSLLEHINSHAVPKYAQGGLVGGMFSEPAAPPAYTYAANSIISKAYQQELQHIQQQVQQILAARRAAAAGGGPGGQSVPSGSLQQWLAAAGIPQSQWGYYATLVAAESSGNPLAYNPSGASGIAQMMPGTFSAYGSGNIWNPVDNLRASWAYVQATYGSAGNIPGLGTGGYKGYDSGGWMPPGWGGHWNGTSQPEAVLTQQQWQALISLASGMAGGQSLIPEIHLYLDSHEITASVKRTEWRQARRNGGTTMVLPEHQWGD